MNVLLLTSTFHPTIGGGESYALNLARGLGAIGHTVEVITDGIQGQSVREKLDDNVSVSRLHNYRRELGVPDRIFWEQMQFGLCDEIADILSEYTPDVVFSNSLDLCAPAKLVSLHTGKPWVATFHEQAPERDALGEAILQFAYRVLQPDAVIAGSQFYFDRACRYAGIEKSHLIYHGIDTSQFRWTNSSSAAKRHYGIPESHTLIVSAGRFKPRKGFPDLLQAIYLLRCKGRMISLILAGSLNSASLAHRDILKRLVRDLGIGENVFFEEEATQDRMPWLLSAADVVAQPSLEEGLGLAVLEAMACERAVVASRIPGITEVVTNDAIGILTESENPADLAAALDILIGDPDKRKAMGLSGRAHVAEKFSLERMSAATAALLEAVIAKRG